MNIVCKLTVKLEFLWKYNKRNQNKNRRNTEAYNSYSCFCAVINNLCGTCDLLVISHNCKTAEKNDCLNGISHFLQKAFHRKCDWLVSFTVLVFAVVNNICKKDCLTYKHCCNTCWRNNVGNVKRNCNFKHRTEDIHKYISYNGCNKRNLINLFLVHPFWKNRDNNKTPNRADSTDSLEKALCLRLAEYVGEIINSRAWSEIPACVWKHSNYHKYYELVVVCNNGKNLFEWKLCLFAVNNILFFCWKNTYCWENHK